MTDNSMSCEEVQELLPLYALGALDEDEAEAVASHVPVCPSCTADLVRFDSVTGALGAPLTAVAPDPSVRAGLFDRIATTPQERTTLTAQVLPANVVPINRSRSTAWRAWLVSAAAVLLMLGGGAGYWINTLSNDRDDAQNTVAMLTDFMAPGATAVPMSSMDAAWGGTSKLMKDSDGEMIVLVANCPPSTDSRVYKVWVAIGTDRVVVGDMKIAANGSGWMPVTFPSSMPNPQILGVSVIDGNAPLTDLFIGTMTG